MACNIHNGCGGGGVGESLIFANANHAIPGAIGKN